MLDSRLAGAVGTTCMVAMGTVETGMPIGDGDPVACTGVVEIICMGAKDDIGAIGGRDITDATGTDGVTVKDGEEFGNMPDVCIGCIGPTMELAL